ncbi:MAG: hypothetical protein VX800_02485 [Chloroflexota bacterium]|nr:hypothetical protein [Chloroflexota bacterium]
MRFIGIVGVAVLLIVGLSLPLHVFTRKLSFRETITDMKFWISTVLASILVSLIVVWSEE